MMKMASANVINNGGFLGLMSEMDRIENHHQGNVNGSTTTPTSVSQNISLENTTSPNNNDNNKLGLTSMSSKKSSSSSSTSKGQKKVRKPRYAFQTRSQVDILDDGYRWRKYGQKAVKNNKFPRSYYRCTYQGCNVKKQVQRLTKDESIVVTTYEGMHSHSIDKSTDNFEHILTQMQIYTSF
uniref:WRKY transcription factor n=1 Tax=Boehmeria nivea TaxID=83906 RepID=A0A7U0F5F8_BOENI|nr:WRKY transcription factor [Boehmeria nivea]